MTNEIYFNQTQILKSVRIITNVLNTFLGVRMEDSIVSTDLGICYKLRENLAKVQITIKEYSQYNSIELLSFY